MLENDVLADTRGVKPSRNPEQKLSLKSAGLNLSQYNKKPPFNSCPTCFVDFLDAINPLQHIPVVSSIYRHLTDDKIHPVAKVAGGAIFAGPIGVFMSLIDILVETNTGKGISDHAITILTAEQTQTDSPLRTQKRLSDVPLSHTANSLAQKDRPFIETTKRLSQPSFSVTDATGTVNKDLLDSKTQSYLLEICAETKTAQMS